MRFSVTSGTGTTEVVDHLESARSALDRALDLVSRKRKNVRVFDENGLFRSSSGYAPTGRSGST